MIVVFRISLAKYYYEYLKDDGFITYTDPKVNLATANPDNTPRLIVCLPSIAKLGWLEIPSWVNNNVPVGAAWNVCFDEVGQTRGMTASDLLDGVKMDYVDTALGKAVKAAPVVLSMEYRMLRDDAEWVCDLGGTNLGGASDAGDVAAARFAEDKMWARAAGVGSDWDGKRRVVYTTKEPTALAWLRQLVVESLSVRSRRFMVPILVPCNYSRMAETLVSWLRCEVRDLCEAANISEDDTAALMKRIRLVNQEQTASCIDNKDPEWNRDTIHECFADPTKFAMHADIVVATYSLQAGVSIESHFQMCCPFLYTWVGDWYAANQVRDIRCVVA